jgi:hypothetical protein
MENGNAVAGVELSFELELIAKFPACLADVGCQLIQLGRRDTNNSLIG